MDAAREGCTERQQLWKALCLQPLRVAILARTPRSCRLQSDWSWCRDKTHQHRAAKHWQPMLAKMKLSVGALSELTPRIFRHQIAGVRRGDTNIRTQAPTNAHKHTTTHTHTHHHTYTTHTYPSHIHNTPAHSAHHTEELEDQWWT